jgi:hypothetical protein
MSVSAANSDSLEQRAANWPPSWSLPQGETRAWWMGTGLPQLIWREGRSLLVWFATSLLLSLGIMTFYMVPQLDNPETNAAFYTLESMQWLYLHAWLGPIIFLLGALASGFAAERENPSFQWCTSLPMRWYQAWSVKLGLTLIGALACWAICWYAAGVWTQFLPWVHPTMSQQRSYDRLPVEMAGRWPIVLAIYSLGVLCLLLTRHVLAGIGLAAGVSLGLAVAWLGPPMSAVSGSPIDTTTTLYRAFVFLFDPTVVSVGFLALSAVAYRWRWYRGIYASGWFGGFGGARPAVAAPAAAIAWGPAWSRPTAAMALLWLAWRKISWLGWWGGAAAIVLVISGQIERSGNSPVVFTVFPLAMLALFFLFGLVSVWSVAGERAGEPQSFLAERGVSPTGYWWSRYAVMVLGSVLLLTGLYLALNELGRLTQRPFVPPLPTEGYAWTLLMFALALHAIGSLGLLAGQLLRSWEVAFLGLIVCTILLLMLAANANETSGLPGLVWGWGVVLLVVPLSWALSWVGLARWQPRLGWVFPLVFLGIIAASLLGVSWLRVQVLPPPNPVLAQARSLPAIQANVLHGFRYWYCQPFLPAGVSELRQYKGGNLSPRVADGLRVIVQSARVGLEQQLQWIETCEQPNFDPADIDSRIGPRWRDTASPQSLMLSYEELSFGEISQLQRNFGVLGENTIVALELGELEVAELLLQLRVKLLTAARPILGACSLDVHQTAFLESLYFRVSDPAIVSMQSLLEKQPHLLTGDPKRAREDWRGAMESQFSFIYRKGFGWSNTTNANDSPDDGTEEVAGDRWLRDISHSRMFHSRAVLPWNLLPNSVQDDWERQRYQREVGAAYEQFQEYCHSGRLPRGLLETNIGKKIAIHRLFDQVTNFHQEQLHTQRIQARAAALVKD